MILDVCRKLLTPWRGGNLFVGFSGGADSTAALLLTSELRDELGFRLTAVHFNHHLRGAESDAEAAAAVDRFEKLSRPCPEHLEKMIELLRSGLDRISALFGNFGKKSSHYRLFSGCAPSGLLLKNCTTSCDG